MKKSLARGGRRFVADMLFRARKALVDKGMDPSRDSTLLSWATYSPWLRDAEFGRVHAAIAGNTLVDQYRCWELWHLLGQSSALPGDVLEVGTWRGGTGALLAARARQLELDATVFLCDTFTGVVKAGDEDANYGGGEHADTSEPLVRELLAGLGLENVEILRGIFPDDTGDQVAGRTFRLVHIDVDAYRSAREVLDWAWPRLEAGGIVVFDDFGFPSTAGIARLVHEVEARDDLVCLQNLNGHAVLVKLR